MARPRKSDEDKTARVAIVCNNEQFDLIAIDYAFIPPNQRSKYFLQLFKEAIAANHPCFISSKTRGCKKYLLYISMPPKDLEAIDDYVSRKFGDKQRSTWMLAVLLPDY